MTKLVPLVLLLAIPMTLSGCKSLRSPFQRRAVPPVEPEDAEPKNYVSTISFEPFEGTNIVSWVQPSAVSASGDTVPLFVHLPRSKELVQQDRLTDDLVLCTAQIKDRETGRATIVGGNVRGEPAPLAAPDLSAFELVLEGQNGETYVARICSDENPKVIYEGHLLRTERYNTSFRRKLARGLDPSETVLGVHAYVTVRAGTDAVELDLRIHNGANNADLQGFCGKIYYNGLALNAAGYSFREGMEQIAEGQNVFPMRTQLVRRFVLEPAGGRRRYVKSFRTAYASEGASYFTEALYGPDKTLVPRVDISGMLHRAQDLSGSQVGPFRMIDVTNSDAPGGKWIFPFMGGCRGIDPRGRSLETLELIADRVEERMPIAFFNKDGGEPLTSHDLAVAHGGMQPFQYDVQARQGIRRWDLEGQPRLPSGTLTGTMGLRDSGTQSINQGSCSYESELGRWQPYDGQHLIRGYTHAAALWFWTGDPLSADWIRMVAADAGYDFTASVEAAPGQGANCDREWAWTSIVTSLACQIESSRELKARCGSLLQFATTSAMPTGIPWRIHASGTGGNIVYWNNYGTPADVDACGTFQVPMIAFAMSSLTVVEDNETRKAEALDQIVRMADSVLDPAAFTESMYHQDEVGPPMSTWVAQKGGQPFRFVGGSGKSNPTNFPLLYALAAKASGSPHWLQRIEDVGRPGPKNLTQMAKQDTGFSEAFAAMAIEASATIDTTTTSSR